MCGINGIFAYGTGAPPVDPAELLRTRDRMQLRGPDAAGQWLNDDGRVGFGHRRLAIIDLSEAGAQPMHSADGRLTIVFNGEIYNYRELREQLIADGANLRSHSDTEVLLHLYTRRGEAMVHDLRGMYAFAVWDARDRSLFLARDPYGIKPLYYADDGRSFRFASQVKGLLAGGSVSPAVDPGGLVGFLVWGNVPDPLTFHEAIRALPAGHTMRVRAGVAATPKSFWNLGEVIARSTRDAKALPHGGAQEEIREVLREALLDSVRAHLVADVPVGAFLSAGLDSSTLVGFAREFTSDLRTITFSSEEFRGSTDEEGPLAAEVARHFGVPHERRTIGQREFDTDLEAFFEAMDQPTIDGLNTWFVSKAAKDAGLKVALSGLGGDELFGSYPTFANVPAMQNRYRWLGQHPRIGAALTWMQAASRRRSRQSRPMLDGAASYGASFGGAYLLQRGWTPPWQLEHVIRPELAREGLSRLERLAPMTGDEGPSELGPFGKVAYLEATRYMRNQLLRDSDWAAMAHSLEIRVPLVDVQLTERVIGLAASGLFPQGKAVLAEVVPRGLPASILNRPKTGFVIPIWSWLATSRLASAWKQNRFMSGQGMGAYGRWAYCVLAHHPQVAGELR